MKLFGYLSLLFFITSMVLFFIGTPVQVGVSLVLMFLCMLAFFRGHTVLKNFSFTIWVLIFVTISMVWPAVFGTWFGFNLGVLIVPLIQIIMFGMGTTLSVKDFSRVVKMPLPVLIGMVLQFTVMPLLGISIALLFGFDPEIAAGIVLIGSCPGGVASNLMVFIAGGNVALSVTMTSCSTLLSPLMTPFLMKTLAGKMVPIDFIGMMMSILNMIIVPIIAGLIANRILYSKSKRFNSVLPLLGLSFFMTLAAICAGMGTDIYGPLLPVKNGLVLGFSLIAFTALLKLIIGIWLKGPSNWMDRVLPLVSMLGICFIIAIITARSSEKLLSVGLMLIGAGVIHNLTGYLLGYWLSRLARQDEITSRTIAFEVGMQNGGMASGLAMTVLHSANTALAPAIFGPWMNISGSMLANYWQKKPVKNKK